MFLFWRKVSRRRWQLVNERDQVLRTVLAREPRFRVPNRYVVFGESWVFGESFVTSTHGSLEAAQAAAEESTGLVTLHEESQATATVLPFHDSAEDTEPSARVPDGVDASGQAGVGSHLRGEAASEDVTGSLRAGSRLY